MAEVELKAAEAEKKALANAQRADAAERKAAELQAALSKAQADGQAALAKAQADLSAAKANENLLEKRVVIAEAKVKVLSRTRGRALNARPFCLKLPNPNSSDRIRWLLTKL